MFRVEVTVGIGCRLGELVGDVVHCASYAGWPGCVERSCLSPGG